MEPIVWTMAGSDPSGGAGLQVDLKTFNSFSVHGCSIITAITAQNITKIGKIKSLSPEDIRSQITILQKELPPKAVKIGMLGDPSSIEVVKDFLSSYSGEVVVDPVMMSTSGKNLFTSSLTEYLSPLQTIFPLVSLITPNVPEAEKLLNRSLNTYQDIEKAADEILSLGVESVLIKGGHIENDDLSQDYWTNGSESFWLANHRYPGKNYRGTGCVLSSAIAACLALGYDIKDAIVIAKMYVSRGINLAEKDSSAIIKHAGWPEDQECLPYLTSHPLHTLPEGFPDFKEERLGLYPVVDNITWIQKLLSVGVKTIQLRIKNKQGKALENEIVSSIELAKKYGAKLFVNDYWEIAIHHGAYGVHLGQEDINIADIKMIFKAGLRLGISTHSYYEVARAHALKPSYMACGPIFPTTSKMMPFVPQGLSQLKRWRRTLDYPLVAIGGINLERFPDVLMTNVDGIALISDITHAQDPIARAKQLLTMVNQYVINSE